jgi:hypothetical protein
MTTTVTRQGDRLILATPYELKTAVKRLPTRQWDKKRRVWHVAATQETAAATRAELGDLQVDESTLKLMARATSAEAARPLRFADELPPIPGVPKSEMNPDGGGWLSQRRGYWFGLEQEGSAMVIGMGGGKSLVTVKLFEAWDVRLVVILCPSKVRKVWPREFSRWRDRDWIVDNGRFRNKRSGAWLKSSSVSLQRRVDRMHENIEKGRREKRPVAIVVNYEAAWQGAMREFLLGLSPDVFVLDESHKVKRAGGKWSRFTALMGKRAPRRIGLTGTLFPHSEPDVYAQYRTIDPGVFGTNFGHFKRHFFEIGGFEGKEIERTAAGGAMFIDDTREKEFTEAWQRIAYIDEEGPETPGAIDAQPAIAEMGSETAKVYKEISSDFITWVRNGGEDDLPVTAANALARILRLQQITSGHLPVGVDEERELVSIGDEKKKLLHEELDDIPPGEPVVVYARFTEDLNRIQEVAEERGMRYAEVSGRRDDGLIEDPDDPAHDAMMNKECDLCGCQLQAIAEGVDLTRSAYGIFYSLILDLGNYLQVRKRQDRPGQTRTVRFGFLELEGTIDAIIRGALTNRENAVGAVVAAAKEFGRLEAVEEM